MARIVVAGGGLAGLSSSVALADRGHLVTPAERRSQLGGRTHVLPSRKQGDVVDNGQHVLLAGYRQTRAFLGTIGTAHLVRVQPRQATLFHDPAAGPNWLRSPELPGAAGKLAPLLGILGLANGPWRDRLRGLRAFPALAAAAREPRPELDQVTADAWLRELGVPASLRRAFWDPLIVSTLNEKPERVSAHMLALLLAGACRASRPRRGSPIRPSISTRSSSHRAARRSRSTTARRSTPTPICWRSTRRGWRGSSRGRRSPPTGSSPAQHRSRRRRSSRSTCGSTGRSPRSRSWISRANRRCSSRCSRSVAAIAASTPATS